MMSCQPIEKPDLDDLLPVDVGETFSSMELSKPSAVSQNIKREVRPFFGLIMDIIDTLHSSTKSDLKRAQIKGNLYVS